MALKDYLTGTTNKILIGAATAVGLIITGVAGVSVFTPAYQVRDSGGQVKWQVNLGGQSTQSGVIASKTLANCDTIDGTSTGMLVCGTDDGGSSGGGGNWSGTGALQTAFDGRYVNTSGDTMTGKLLINLTSGTDALEVVQTASASRLHANTLLTVSGSVVVEDNITIDGLMSFVGYSASPQLTAADNTTGIHFDGPGIVSIHNGGTQTMLLSSTNRVGIGIGSPETKLEVEGTVSGSVLYGLQSLRSSGALTWEGAGSGASLYIGDDFEGAGLTDCDADNQAISWDATSKRFICGDDDDTNTTYTAAQGLTLNGTAFSLTPAHSGSVINATTTLASSGSLTWESDGSGSALYIGGQFSGVGLVDCDLSTQTLAWDATTKRFSCGTDSDTTYTAGQGLTLTSTVFSTNATLTGTMLRFLTVSGSLVYAKNTLASSGTLAVEGTAEIVGALTLGVDLTVPNGGTGFGTCTDGGMLTGDGTNPITCNAILSDDQVYIGDGTTEPTATTLPSCSAAGDTLNYNTTTNAWACGTDADTTYIAGQGLSLISNSFRLNASFSGTTIWATTTLRSSGALTWEGAGSGANLTATTLSGTFVRAGKISPRYLSMEIFSSGSTITTGSGKAFMVIPDTMSGYNLSSAWVSVGTGGYTNSTTVQVRNAEKGFRKLFSTPLTLDDRRYGSGQVVISTANRDVGAFNRLFIDIPNVTTTAPKSPMVLMLKFYLP